MSLDGFLKSIKRSMKSKKAVSPVIAVIMLIAIAVAASVYVYYYTLGMVTTISSAKLNVEDFSYNDQHIYVHIQNSGGEQLTIDKIYVYDSTSGEVWKSDKDSGKYLKVYDAKTGQILNYDDNGVKSEEIIILQPGEGITLDIVLFNGSLESGDIATLEFYTTEQVVSAQFEID